MSSRLIINIRQLVNTREQSGPLRGAALRELPSIENAWLLIEGSEIAGYGPMSQLPPALSKVPTASVIDATGRLILPAWCDSHTHLVFAGSRETEFVDKIKGLSYAEINARGVTCHSGSCSEIYLERAFPPAMRPGHPLPVAHELGETSLMFLVHPPLRERDMYHTCDVTAEVMAEAVQPRP